jgi:CDP-diacylglycerol--glycerol-3-phosphate 3-phosphatidyltransferase
VLHASPAWLIPAPAVAIIGREITMSGAFAPRRAPTAETQPLTRRAHVSAFREWASASGGDAHKAVAVNSLGKWKTATQMTAITALLGAGAAGPAAHAVAASGIALLWASAGLALASLWIYMKAGLPHMLK